MLEFRIVKLCSTWNYFKMKFYDYSKIDVFLVARSNNRKGILRECSVKACPEKREMLSAATHQTLYGFGKVALPDKDAATILQDLYENELEHQGSSVRLEQDAFLGFHSISLRNHSRALSCACNGGQFLCPIMIDDDGSMRRISFHAGETLSRKFNFKMGSNPLPMEDNSTNSTTVTVIPLSVNSFHSFPS